MIVSLTALALGSLLYASAAFAQGWVGPQEPCDISAGHFLVNGGIQQLRIAADAGDDEDRRQHRLEEAYRVLRRAIVENDQGDNPAAWYYLGRYYSYTRDPFGADSAYRRALELAPQCESDIQRYVGQLAPQVLASALEAWQQQQPDTAVRYFRLARSLEPDNADVPLFMSMMHAEQRQFDSAEAYLEMGLEVAGDDPHYDRRQRQAVGDIARAYETVGFEHPAVQRILESRMVRDTLVRALERDSTQLAALLAEWAGQNLRPDVQQAVSRDSARLADKVAAAREALGPARTAFERDSVEAAQAMADALAAYERYLELFPDDDETAGRLLRRYSMLGQTQRMRPLMTRLMASDAVTAEDLTGLGLTLFNDGNVPQAVEVLEASLERNPVQRDALFVLCRAHYGAGNAEQLSEVAEQLLDLDPLNPQSVRMMAAAWDLAGNRDSVMKYVALADTGLGWAVTVTQMLAMESATTVNGSVANVTSRQLPATTLEFEFLAPDRSVIGTVTVEIPPLDPRRRHQVRARIEQGGAVGWRYRRR
jgi:tetratricopeptide (TPR) repeat protein